MIIPGSTGVQRPQRTFGTTLSILNHNGFGEILTAAGRGKLL
jgi:hypothetical protein